MIDKYKASNGLYCIKDPTQVDLYGSNGDHDSISFYIALVPCAEDKINKKNCAATQEQTAKYLEGAVLTQIYNNERFDS